MTSTKTSYWGAVGASAGSLWTGLKITLGHFMRARKKVPTLSIADPAYFNKTEGIATIQFPHEMLPVPDTGRYRLHNEIDDCIVCDKCAKVCPVNCITIDPIKSPDEIGKTSDGTPKRIYAAKFDIDMGKCCFCGLCTTVCPTECLTMTKVYDFSVFDIREHNFAFGEMTAQEITDKTRQWDEYQARKKATAPPAPAVAAVTATAPAAITAPASDAPPATPKPAGAKPVFKPKVKAPTATAPADTAATPAPAISPEPAAPTGPVETPAPETPAVAPKPAAARPVFRPKIKPPAPPSTPPES